MRPSTPQIHPYSGKIQISEWFWPKILTDQIFWFQVPKSKFGRKSPRINTFKFLLMWWWSWSTSFWKILMRQNFHNGSKAGLPTVTANCRNKNFKLYNILRSLYKIKNPGKVYRRNAFKILLMWLWSWKTSFWKKLM